MANEFEYFPLYVRLLLLDTQDMSNEEFGAYCRLFMQSWDQNPVGFIPASDDSLARLSRCKDDVEWARVKSSVLSRFRRHSSGRLYQKRLVETYRALKDTFKAKKAHGLAGAKARWNKEKHARAMPEHSPPNGNLKEKEKEKSSPPADARGMPGEPDPLVVGVRDFLNKHPLLSWNQIAQDGLVTLVREKGWPWTEKAIDGRISEGDGDPIGSLAKRLKRPGFNGTSTRPRSAVAAADREDN